MTSGVYERTPETRAKMSAAKMGVPKSLSHCAAISKAKKGVPKPPRTPEHNVAISVGMENSEAVKDNADKMRGGDDIVEHHYLYDDADLSKYTMLMTRSEHMSMHNRMRANGYKVPRINSETDDNGLWGYHKCL